MWSWALSGITNGRLQGACSSSEGAAPWTSPLFSDSSLSRVAGTVPPGFIPSLTAQPASWFPVSVWLLWRPLQWVEMTSCLSSSSPVLTRGPHGGTHPPALLSPHLLMFSLPRAGTYCPHKQCQNRSRPHLHPYHRKEPSSLTTDFPFYPYEPGVFGEMNFCV